MEHTAIESNIQLTHDWFERVWNHNDLNYLRRRLSPDVTFRLPEIGGDGIEAFISFQTDFRGNFEEVWVEVSDLVENKSGVVGNGNLTALHRKTRKPVDVDFSVSVRWKEGQIIECHCIVDFDDLMRQAGTDEPVIAQSSIAKPA